MGHKVIQAEHYNSHLQTHQMIRKYYLKSILGVTKDCRDKIGGPNIIVVISTFSDDGEDKSKVILIGFAEIKKIPARHIFDIFNPMAENKTEWIKQLIKLYIKPGTLLVLDKCVSEENMLSSLQEEYPSTVSIDMLMKHNTEHNNVINNVEMIWKTIFYDASDNTINLDLKRC